MFGFNNLYPGKRNAQSAWVMDGATADSTHSKWGTYAARCNGASNTSSIYIERGWSNYFKNDETIGVGGGHGTVEFWYYNETTPSGNSLLWEMQEVSTEVRIVQLTNNKTYLQAYYGGANLYTDPAALILANDTWYHIAIVLRDNVYADFYCNGNKIGATLGNGTDILTTSGGDTWRLGIGTYDGYFSDLRISTNARYSGATYTVPTAEFVNDEHTYCLFHFNENTSDYFLDDNT